MFRASFLALAISAASTGALLAGEQYIDETGYAVSGYDVVSYWSLDQVEVGEVQPSPQKGRASLTADYNGATFAFASEENRQTFLEDPEMYVPQYDGHCAYGVAKGGKVPGNPTLWRIVDDKLYLNITDTVVGFWEEDIPGNLELSESNWVGLEEAPASGNTIPKWSSDAPLGE